MLFNGLEKTFSHILSKSIGEGSEENIKNLGRAFKETGENISGKILEENN